MAQEMKKACQGKPLRQYGPYGNLESASTFNFVIDETDRITTVKIGSGQIVDGIGFDIVHKDGKTKSIYYGGIGQEEHKIHMLDNEYITQISGFAGDYAHANNRRHVVQIKFYTNLAPEGYGPYGRMIDCKITRPFTSPEPVPDGHLVGFFGATGDHLEKVGAYMRKDD